MRTKPVTAMYEYRVCHVLEDRVTFANGAWLGKDSEVGASLQSCPFVWEYLQEVGAAGWDLAGVAARTSDEQQAEVLYLRRSAS